MNETFYTPEQYKVFSEDLIKAFTGSGFELVEEPYVDYALYGFRATFIRRYLLHKPKSLYDGILATLIQVIGLPFGHHNHKMVIISAPRNIKNEPVSDTIKLRIHFDENGQPFVVHGDTQSNSEFDPSSCGFANIINNETFHQQQTHILGQNEPETSSQNQTNDPMKIYLNNLQTYVRHIIELISPGIIALPTEMKLEILKKLNVDSIIKMSQVNNEFRILIFKKGESLWRHLCSRDFNIRIINRLVHRSWMELYRDTYIEHQIKICRKERALPGLPERPALPPAPYRLPIGWLPEFMAGVQMIEHEEPLNEPLNLALEIYPLRRAHSLESLH